MRYRLIVRFLLLGSTMSHVAAESHCLDQLSARATAFDETFDRNSQGFSFSCEISITASQALEALEDFRYGFLYDSKAHIERSVEFPLRVNLIETDKQTRQVLLSDYLEWQQFKKTTLTKYEHALIACATLKNVRIYRRDGGFSIGLGRVWFVPGDGGVKVRVINASPMENALFQWLCLGEEPSAGPLQKQ